MKYKVVLRLISKHVYRNNEADHCTFNSSATSPQLSVEMTVHYATGRIQIVVGFVMGSPAALTIRRRKENKATYCHVSTLSRAVTNFHSLRYNICKTT